MVGSSSTFIALEKPIKDYIQEEQNENIPAKTQRDVRVLSEFLKRKKREEKLKKSNQMNLTSTCANIF